MQSSSVLDYTHGCVNFRDVGEWVAEIGGRPVLPIGRLFRGGKLTFVGRAEEIGSPGTILNLRKSHDQETFGADYYCFSISNDFEKYETHRREVRDWLRQILHVFENDHLRYPVLIHCTSGKDRTGVAVAALLHVLEVPADIIVREYLLSDGYVRAPLIRQALDSLGEGALLRAYFGRIDLARVRRNVLAQR